MGFKVGDRVRCIDTDRAVPALTAGEVYTVEGFDSRGWVNLREKPNDLCGYYPSRFVKDPKLEVGATVRLKGGVDEWEVTHTGPGWASVARGASCADFQTEDLVVVKAKPEPPKPDYYVNCKGAEPKHGDVFTTGREAAYVDTRGNYVWIPGGGKYPLSSRGYSHRVGSPASRVLVARNGKPYVGV